MKGKDNEVMYTNYSTVVCSSVKTISLSFKKKKILLIWKKNAEIQMYYQVSINNGDRGY